MGISGLLFLRPPQSGCVAGIAHNQGVDVFLHFLLQRNVPPSVSDSSAWLPS